jgi:hypothetical protein
MGGADTLAGWLGELGAPADPVAWTALGAGLAGFAWLMAAPRFKRLRIGRVAPPMWLAALSALAVVLSAGYVVVYLGGGPRIIDATSYFLEARALSHGDLSFPTPDPSSSFRGRFLVNVPGRTELGVIFPPGYPLLLALGMVFRMPMAIGPLLGGALVVATYALGRELTGRREVGLLAAAASAICAALRYHTADTMAHGWSALLLTVALWSSLRGGRWGGAVAGLGTGWLLATRPVTGLVVIAVCGFLAWRRHGLVPFLLALVPGVGLLMAHQHAVTGSFIGSTQLHYYALADGPPGCFRYGFGRGIGCLHEHGDFVASQLPHGFSVGAALTVTWHRLYSHFRDAWNFQPCGLLLLPWILVRVRTERRLVPALVLVLGVMLAYLPFYFDGSYPGGGARLFADILPLEHVLGAAVLGGAAPWLVPAALLGFALQTGSDHRALQRRDGGHPMFDPAVLARNHIESGLLFVDTDHGFNLAHRPAELDARRGLVVARLRRDAYDTALWEGLGRPPTYLYYSSARTIVPYQPRWSPLARFEAESAWPPLGVDGGWVRPEYLGEPCVSAGRGLRLLPTGADGVSATLDVSVPAPGRYLVSVGWVARRTGALEVAGELRGVEWRDEQRLEQGRCWAMRPAEVELGRGSTGLRVWSRSDLGTLDYVDIRPASPERPPGTGSPDRPATSPKNR